MNLPTNPYGGFPINGRYPYYYPPLYQYPLPQWSLLPRNPEFIVIDEPPSCPIQPANFKETETYRARKEESEAVVLPKNPINYHPEINNNSEVLTLFKNNQQNQQAHSTISKPQIFNKEDKKKTVNNIQAPIKIEEVENQEKADSKAADENQLIEQLIHLFQSYDSQEYKMLLEHFKAKKLLKADVIEKLDLKIKSFKKSKEEMIKIIIRRTQKHYKTVNQTRKDNRFVKYGGFKSMNTAYLETMFSDHLFVESFEHVVMEFYQEFESENIKKIIAFYEMTINPLLQSENSDKIVQILSEKNKMPWPGFWMNKMMKTIFELYDTYSKQYKKEIVLAQIVSHIDQ